MRNKYLAELCVIKQSILILIIPIKYQHRLIFQNSIELLLSNLGYWVQKLIKFNAAFFILIKVLEYLK